MQIIKSLSEGSLNFFLVKNQDKLLGFSRTLGNEKLFIILNNNDEEKNVELNLETINENSNFLTNLIGDNKFKHENNVYNINLKPYQIMILK